MKQYLDLLKHITENGVRKGDRTGTGTISTFGHQIRFDLSESFPLLTTKKVFLKGIIHELLWLISGSTNIKYLQENGVKIWDEWADKYGNLGPVYGEQWRKWKHTDAERHVYSGSFDHLTTNDVSWTVEEKAIDQLADVIEAIKNNPNSRRHIVTAWNPGVVDKMALPPCHCFFQFYVVPYTALQRVNIHLGKDKDHKPDFIPDDTMMITTLPNMPDIDLDYITTDDKYLNDKMDKYGIPKGKLSCQLYQRSADVFLGVPFNIASYALLTMMVAQVCDLELGEFIHTFGDVHIYNNHIDQVKLQLTREPKPGPKMIINPDIKSIDDFKYEDFTLEGYEHHPKIKAEVSI